MCLAICTGEYETTPHGAVESDIGVYMNPMSNVAIMLDRHHMFVPDLSDLTY